jgi:hypothetical protein
VLPPEMSGTFEFRGEIRTVKEGENNFIL